MRILNSALSACVLFGISGLMSGGALSGGSIIIRDLTDTATLEVQGTLFGAFSGNANSCSGETCSFSLNAPTFNAAGLGIQPTIIASFNYGLVVLREGSLTGPLSDYLNCSDCGGSNTFWQFKSDTDGVPLTLPANANSPVNNLVEDGTPQLAVTISYLGGGGTQNSALRLLGQDFIYIQSDAETPEPSTWLMALSGLGAVGYALRRRSV
jgi:hypothetical protein